MEVQMKPQMKPQMQLQNLDCEFRPLTEEDFPQLLTWLNEPLVNQWYCSNRLRTMEYVYEKYAPRISGLQPTDCFVAVIEGVDAGLIQRYWVADYPDYGESIGAEPGWMGIDYFIGEPSLRGRGCGAPLLRRFVDDMVFHQRQALSCVSSPHPNNLRSIRTLERAGFSHLRTVDVDGELEYVMIRKRKDVSDRSTSLP